MKKSAFLIFFLLLVMHSCVIIKNKGRVRRFAQAKENNSRLKLNGYYFFEDSSYNYQTPNITYLSPPDTVGEQLWSKLITTMVLQEDGTAIVYGGFGGIYESSRRKWIYPNSYEAGHKDFQEYLRDIPKEKIGNRRYGNSGYFSTNDSLIEIMIVNYFSGSFIIPITIDEPQLFKGKVLNDSTFVLTQLSNNGSRKKWKAIYETYKFRKHDSIPEGKTWVSKRIE